MSLDKDLAGAVRLNGENIHIWKWQIKAVLIYKRLLGIVDGTDLESAATDKEAWRDKQWQAYSLLCSSVERDLFGTLVECKTAKEIWDTILSTFELKTSEHKQALQTKFFEAKLLPGQLLTDYFASLNMIRGMLTDIGDKTFTSDEAMMAKLISTVSIDYSGFLTAWESTTETEQTLVNLKLRLLKEEVRIKQKTKMEISTNITAFFTQRTSGSSFPADRSGFSLRGCTIAPSSGSSNRGRGYNPTGRGYYVPPTCQTSRSHGNFSSIPSHPLGEHYSSRSSPVHSQSPVNHIRPELVEFKKCTRCNCCGCYGHWWQECQQLFIPEKRYFLESKMCQARAEPTRAYHIETGRFTSQHPIRSLSNHLENIAQEEEPPDQDTFEDSLEHLQLEDNYE
jgi:hypothetical protein